LFVSGLTGGGHASVTAELTPNIYTDVKEPTITPYFNYDTLSPKIKLTLSVFVIPSVEINLYEGAVNGKVSVTLGPQLETLSDFSGEACDIFDGLDVSLATNLDMEMGTKFDESLKEKKNLSKSWPLFKLDGRECPNTSTSTCSGDDFFGNMVEEFGDKFNSEIFLAQGVTPSDPLFPSTGKRIIVWIF
jgi:hypothetical protein